jgi:hypothetical protein
VNDYKKNRKVVSTVPFCKDGAIGAIGFKQDQMLSRYDEEYKIVRPQKMQFFADD